MNGEKGFELEERLLRMAKGKTKEDIIREVKETILDAIAFYQKYTHKRRSSTIFHIIAFNIIPEPEGKKFIADNFSKIIQFGFKNGEPQDDLVQLIKIVANKLKVDNKLPLHDDMEANYQQILSQHKEVRGQLEKLKEVCGGERFYKEFYVFIDFIYSSKKEKEEQDREKELQAEKAARELLEEAAKETGYKPKQPQQKKKKKRNKANSSKKAIISNEKINEPEVQDSKEEFEDEEVKELRKNLKELRELLLHDKSSKKLKDEKLKELESKINQAIENYEQSSKIGASNIDNEKTKDLYIIKIDFHLSCAIWNIDYYNKKYDQIIKRTKGDFGTKKFSPEHNKYITSNLTDIASMVQGVDTDLKEALLVLDKMTHLVYKDYSQQNDEVLLEIIGQEYRKLVGEFLDHLKALGEWHDNKLHVVKEHKIYSKTKNDQERVSEKEALNIIKSCVDSLDTFVGKLGYTQDSNVSDSNVKSPMECYGSYQSQEDDNSHKEWCILHNVNVKNIHELSPEMRDCSCKL